MHLAQWSARSMIARFHSKPEHVGHRYNLILAPVSNLSFQVAKSQGSNVGAIDLNEII